MLILWAFLDLSLINIYIKSAKIKNWIFVDVRKNGHKGVRCLQRMTNCAVGNKMEEWWIIKIHSLFIYHSVSD